MRPKYTRYLPRRFSHFTAEELEGSVDLRFRAIVDRFGARPALRHGDITLSYRCLDARSNALALHLLERGVGREPLALLFRQGSAPVVAQLAVLKSGACLAHLDPARASMHQAAVLRDLGARLLLCDSTNAPRALALGAALGLEVIDTETLTAECTDAPERHARPHDPAFIAYTSGSTGSPRGVVLTHQNVLHFSRSHTRYMHLRHLDRATQLCPLWTAASAAEIFPVLLNGATLYPFAPIEDGLAALASLLRRERISMLCCVPTLFRMLVRALAPDQRFPAMRMLRLAGERTLASDVDAFRRHFPKRCLLRAGLGASEVLMYAQLFIRADDRFHGPVVPAGFALEDHELLLLDDTGRPVPRGKPGEIVVRSHYLSPGYWNDDAHTRERFRPDPDGSGRRQWFSRDIGYLDDDGCLHHLGRKDGLVKINGQLVPTGVVERALLDLPGVSEAAILPFDSAQAGISLAAWVVVQQPELDAETLRARLARVLPPDLLPRRLRVLDALPLLPHGKLDRVKLRALAED